MLSELIDEFEERLRLIIREEIRMALSESKLTEFQSSGIKPSEIKIEESRKAEKEMLSIKKGFPTVLTAQEIAPLLNITVPRLYELVRERKANGFPVIILGERQYRFSKEAVLAWLERNNS